MHERFRLATVAAVLAAVTLLGIPLLFFAVQVTQQAALTDLEYRTERTAGLVDASLNIGLEITPETLAEYDDLMGYVRGAGGDLPARAIITMPPDDRVVTVGPEIAGATRSVFTVSALGARIEFVVSWWQLQRTSLPAVLMVLLTTALAIAAGTLVANRQANRLAEPLVYLEAGAQQLGLGRVRLSLEPTGIEEIDLVAEELSRSADRMARRLAAEREFAADASHQLRTPLTALSMRLEEIEAMSDQEDVREEARISLEQIERLTATISELLGRSSRDRADTIEALHLSVIAGQQEEEWEPVFAAEERELLVDVPDNLCVLATPGALSQVIATLLENSLKHGGGTTRMCARVASGGVAVEVADAGPGVSDDIAPHIFERHVTSGGGTGLGLALARDLAAHDSGRLELSARRPAVFTLFLRSVP
ncbi:MAG: HAMP domain-containing histidine kinase, partial [Bifidobacteriaceae bacterium]|nr:HAMP domain-containing histidine kinase [Bifidobacteriaceae bacterium]